MQYYSWPCFNFCWYLQTKQTLPASAFQAPIFIFHAVKKAYKVQWNVCITLAFGRGMLSEFFLFFFFGGGGKHLLLDSIVSPHQDQR